MDREEKVIRSTDYDALSCRVSASRKGYLKDDPYLSNLVNGYDRLLKFEYKLSSKRILNSILHSNKMPVINRGTYIRTIAIDTIIQEFIKKFEGENIRIVNLGAGSDTRCFKLLKRYKKLEIVEFDFPKSTKLKHATILIDNALSSIVGTEYLHIDDSNELEKLYTELNPSLITNRYKLHAIDLRDIESFKEILNKYDNQIPTLIISECMLCYTESKVSDQIITSLNKYFEKGSIAIYDPIGGNDNFGNVMISNLNIRNISMPSLLEFNTLEKYKIRLENLGITNVKSDNMFNVINNWINNDEKLRISKLEFLDEIEELRLLLQHYCLFIGYWGFEWEEISTKFTY